MAYARASGLDFTVRHRPSGFSSFISNLVFGTLKTLRNCILILFVCLMLAVTFKCYNGDVTVVEIWEELLQVCLAALESA